MFTVTRIEDDHGSHIEPPLTCGWPNGIHQEDGWCDTAATQVFMVKVHDAPLLNPDAEPRVAILCLCAEHAPNMT